jgi:cytochrome P450 / NADPH-cytochrome P450 reductase
VEWISNIEDTKAFEGVKYAVFGCGNKDWAATYQRIPKLIDTTLEAHGAQRIVERGAGDSGGDGFFESFDQWEDGLWKVLTEVNQSSFRRWACLLTNIRPRNMELVQRMTSLTSSM